MFLIVSHLTIINSINTISNQSTNPTQPKINNHYDEGVQADDHDDDDMVSFLEGNFTSLLTSNHSFSSHYLFFWQLDISQTIDSIGMAYNI